MPLNYFNRRELETPTATRSRELPLPIRADRRDGRDPGVWNVARVLAPQNLVHTVGGTTAEVWYVWSTR
jgi:hypothetical protein